MMGSTHSTDDCCLRPSHSLDSVSLRNAQQGLALGLDEAQEYEERPCSWGFQQSDKRPTVKKAAELSCYRLDYRPSHYFDVHYFDSHDAVTELAKFHPNGFHPNSFSTGLELVLMGGDRHVLRKFPQIRQWLASYNLSHSSDLDSWSFI
ncbi:MAG: hypothetical protein VKL39_14610 [Leptolyngbyaceae bacterium]|nr:hypothetical protein [Leptolyngbyaceae bacterium]